MTGNGWVRVDCHLHTAVSGDAVTSIDELAERVEQEHLDVVCITDHNVTTAAVAAAERGIGARVIVGEEIRTRDGDVIGLFLTERIPYVLPLAEVTGLIRAQGGLIYLPHPFDPGRSSLGPVAEQLCADRLADVVEVLNEQAMQLAARFGLPGGAGSDAHDPDGIGAAYLEMPDFDGPREFLTSLAQAEITGEHRPHAVRYARRPPASR
jgi:predicted metal-dependent phosphoesterase TrpH